MQAYIHPGSDNFLSRLCCYGTISQSNMGMTSTVLKVFSYCCIVCFLLYDLNVLIFCNFLSFSKHFYPKRLEMRLQGQSTEQYQYVTKLANLTKLDFKYGIWTKVKSLFCVLLCISLAYSVCQLCLCPGFIQD